MRTLFSIAILLLAASTAYCASRNVGSGQTYSTISSALAASSPGDTVVVFGGTYTETPNVGIAGVTIRAADGEAPEIVGRFQVSATNVTVDGLGIRGWSGTGNHGVLCSGFSGLTVRRCRIYDGAQDGSAIYTRNCGNVLIISNELYNCSAGVNINSGRGDSYDSGTRIVGNLVHDNSFDGMDLHGVYLTVQGNYIYNNIATNWATTHPDGIQLIDSTVDGQRGVQNIRIAGNWIKNHTQNIFTSFYTTNVAIWNNVLWIESGVVNGVDLGGIATKNIACWGTESVQIYNNTLIGGNNTGIYLAYEATMGPMAADVRNNIISGVVHPGIGVWVQNSRDLLTLDHNLYHDNGYDVRIASSYYDTLAIYQAAQGIQEVHGVAGDPQLGDLPTPIPGPNSIAIRAGAILGTPFETDLNGRARPTSTGWDIGALQAISGPTATAATLSVGTLRGP